MGGAVYYDSWRPTIENSTYTSNSAVYGPDIASYPIKIIMQGSSTDEITFNNVGSGVQYPSVVSLAIIDYDRQEITNDDTSQIKISSVTTNSSIMGIDYAKVIDGVGTFDNLQFIYEPGAQNIEFIANSKTIDSDLINLVLGPTVSNNSISVNFRW